ncbi:prolactin-releasing peptide receptor-like [Chrysoperla carnea]|uniref:prolactin-releasing peptide receptor-like n=1 Tax=Chrysoperla carnea TaxID=189513 RepID=UPI001D0689F3|nr:prolactin-releasing peptide receptor-like [Chrysoperla carnea]
MDQINGTTLYLIDSILNTTMWPMDDYNCGNSTQFDILDDIGIQVVFFILYTTIFVLGLFGNILVVFVVLRSKSMQTVTNLFIANLALSDILLCALAVPFTPLYTFLGKWVFGRIICHLVPYAQGTSVYISTLTLTSIAIDRFFVIIYPFHPRMKLSTCIAIIVGIWIISFVATIPYGLYMNYKGKDNIFYCEEIWPSERFRKVFGTSTAIVQFWIPFIVIAICYICVSLRLNDRAKAKPGSKNSKKEEADRERKKRTNRMLIAMVAIFGISWSPINLINIVNDFYVCIGFWKYYHLCFFLVHCLAMSSTCYNPFLYAWLNENFRKEFKQVLPCVDRTNGGRNIPQSNRLGNWRSERTCNGNNETLQETLLASGVHRAASVRGVSHPVNSSDSDLINTRNHPHKADSVEVENIMVPTSIVTTASYQAQNEAVRLHLISEEAPVESLLVVADKNEP